MPGRHGKPTLATIADAVGVSTQTVSNVLNSPERVSSATRRRVERAIQRAGYRPSAAAQMLRSRRSGAIALRMPPPGDGINGALLDRFLHNLVTEARELGFRVTLFAAETMDDEVSDLVEMHARGLVDGCVLTDTVRDDQRPRALQAAGIPVVAFGRPWGDPAASHSWVDIDGAAGTAAATRSLLQAGYGTVGFIGWPASSETGADRRAGWASVVGEGTPEELVENDIAEGREAMHRLLAAGVDAVVCASDSLATGAKLAWLDAGGQVASGRLSPVVGFDDTALARYRGFSSVAQPVEQAARECVRLLVARLSEGAPAEQLLLRPHVVYRGDQV